MNFFILVLMSVLFSLLKAVALTPDQAKEIGMKIWNNESNCSVEKLTWWNEGEDFASVGIGHFTWPSRTTVHRFKHSFPTFLTFAQKKGKKLPVGITADLHYCPWNSREEFMQAFNSEPMKKLRTFLYETIDLQVQFILQRFEKALPAMLRSLPTAKQKNHVKQQFNRVLQSPNGVYALVDYLNFKGEGLDPQWNYNGHRWGLLQVLEHMQGTAVGKAVLEEFAKAAKFVLERRVKHAPSDKNEARWLPGWFNRIATYCV